MICISEIRLDEKILYSEFPPLDRVALRKSPGGGVVISIKRLLYRLLDPLMIVLPYVSPYKSVLFLSYLLA